MASEKCPMIEIDWAGRRVRKMRIGPSMGVTVVALVSILTIACLLAAGLIEPGQVGFSVKLPWPW